MDIKDARCQPMGLPEPRLVFQGDLLFKERLRVQTCEVITTFKPLSWMWQSKQLQFPTQMWEPGDTRQIEWSVPISNDALEEIETWRAAQFGNGSAQARPSLDFTAQLAFKVLLRDEVHDNRSCHPYFRVSSEDWIKYLEVWKYDQFLVFEVPVGNFGRPEVGHLVARALQEFKDGDYEGTALQIRRAVEAAAGGEVAEFLNRLFPDEADGATRELVSHLMLGLREIRNAAAHGGRPHRFGRHEAQLSLSVGFALMRYLGSRPK